MGKDSFIRPIAPTESKIKDVRVLKRTIFYDRRGYLVETFAKSKEKREGVYAYVSLAREGQAKDRDQYHFHKKQTDRMTVTRGVMWILLLDARKNSPTYGKLEVLEVKGADPKIRQKIQTEAFTITIPAGVYHGVMAPGPGDAEVVNHPTLEYDLQEEGRIPFKEVPVSSLNRDIFSWDKVKKVS